MRSLGIACRSFLLLTVAALAGFADAAPRARGGAEMARAATRFVAAIPAAQRPRLVLPLASEDRSRWHYLPPEQFARQGIPIKDLDPAQKALAQSLLRSGLSGSGYLAATTIMDLERVLRALRTNTRIARDHEEYFISIFGQPSPGGTWAWRVEGHHLSLHFTVVAGRATVSTPSFFGASPATVAAGEHEGRRALGPLEDAGWALVRALTPAQQAQALLAAGVPDDIVSGNAPVATALPAAGIEARALTPAQLALLETLLGAHTAMMADDIAKARWQRIRAAGLDAVRFAWAGSTEPGQSHYYRVQGPTFLVEFDNTQNGANHIHSVWRDFDGDFGRDLLREHRRQVRH